MKKINQNRTLWFVIINTFISLSTAVIATTLLSAGPLSDQDVVIAGITEGWMSITTFTVLSNILFGIVATFGVIYGIRALRKGTAIPKTFIVWYLVATSVVMLTALTVLLFLAPLRAARGKGYFQLFGGSMFFFHLFNPLLSAICYVFLAPKTRLDQKVLFLTPLPPALYGVVYALNVIVLHTWQDFYGFTFGGSNWAALLSTIVLLSATFGIGVSLDYLRLKQSPSEK